MRIVAAFFGGLTVQVGLGIGGHQGLVGIRRMNLANSRNGLP